MEKINEGLLGGIQKKVMTGEVRKEDDLSSNNHKVLDLYIDSYVDPTGYDWPYRGKYGRTEQESFIHYLNKYQELHRYREDIDDYNLSDFKEIIEYVKKNWDSVREKMYELAKKREVNEGLLGGIQKKVMTGEERKEDQWLDADQEALDAYMDLFQRNIDPEGDESIDLPEFLAFISDYANNVHIEELNPDIEKIRKYVKEHWNSISDDVNGMIDQAMREYREDLNEGLLGGIQKKVMAGEVRKEDDNEFFDERGLYDYIVDHYDFTLKKTFGVFKDYPRIKDNVVEIPVIEMIRPSGGTYYDYLRIKFINGRIKEILIFDQNDTAYKEINRCLGVPGIRREQFCGEKHDSVSITNNKDGSVTIKLVIKVLNAFSNHSFSKIIKKKGKKINEGLLGDLKKKAMNGEERKEDELTRDELRVVDIIFDKFASCVVYGNHYNEDFQSLLEYIKDFGERDIRRTDPTLEYDIEKIKVYLKRNWHDGKNLYMEVGDLVAGYEDEKRDEMNECDTCSPNGGLVIGDVAGMGPIASPGELGPVGSGDLPMPSGVVYQQVAPFSAFVKMKKKKKKHKKFDKRDEPCANYTNPPIYNHVDDFRDYVERTYGNIDRRK